MNISANFAVYSSTCRSEANFNRKIKKGVNKIRRFFRRFFSIQYYNNLKLTLALGMIIAAICLQSL